MNRYFITFGSGYGSYRVHPVLPGITGYSYVVIEATDLETARTMAHKYTKGNYAFIYPMADLEHMINMGYVRNKFSTLTQDQGE